MTKGKPKNQAKLTDFEQNLIIGRTYSYYKHKGCDGVLGRIGFLSVEAELEIAKKLFDGDLRAYYSWLNALDVCSYDFICFRCFGIIRSVEVCKDYSRVFEPDPKKAEFVEEYRYIPYEEHINIILEAYKTIKKYKDGISCKDTHLASAIGKILKDKKLHPKGIYPEGLRLKAVGMPVVEWAIKQGLFKVVKEVDYSIPYAYRKHGWRGIKATIYWRVLKPNLEKLSITKEVGQHGLKNS